MVPQADVLYAADKDFWDTRPDFKGEKWTLSVEAAKEYALNYIPYEKGSGIGDGFVYTGYGNSGFQAVNLALQWGADEVYLIGFDMQVRGDKKHWHPDHKGNNPTECLFREWIRGFHELPANNVFVIGESALGLPRRCMPRSEAIYAVFKEGGWCTPVHVERLREAVEMRTKTPFKVISGEWPGWWSKMALFSPEIEGDALYFDLDTMLFGDIEPLERFGTAGMLGDFYRPKLESGVMYITPGMRKAVWSRWIQSPDRWMAEYRGDGDFIRDTVGRMCSDLRDVGGIHSYKVNGLQPDTRVLCFHGQPRPHETPLWTTR